MTTSKQALSLSIAAAMLAWSGAVAQLQHDHHQHGQGHESPYASQGDTGIASLSPTELEQLEQGEGMGLARPAELNSYPGPRHVLDLTSELALTTEQRAQVQQLFDDMLADAKRIGAQIIESEKTLDRRFAHRHIDDETLRRTTADIARLQGELRFTHLRAHLGTAAVLTGDQIAEYDRLRGYRREEG